MNPSREDALLALALEKPAGERVTWLDRECAGDPVLRRRMDTLLAANEQADTVLAGQAEADPPRTNSAAAPAALPPAAVAAAAEGPGTRIGHYKLLQQIGEGGCGTVFMAEQEEPVRRRVALKVIKLGMDTKTVVARFEAERQALALMDHPNIARVLDAGATASGRPYFVMELVRGVPITRFCDEHKLATKARLELFIKVCAAIQHAHQKGIIHRDIKPSNILVTLHDGVPVPKVIDFGIAKATEGRLTDQTLFTAFEQFIGTPAYMSPEQAQLSGLDIDTRSDIYSLGVLLYELLTGKTPFDAKALLASGLDAIRKTIREVEPPRPSTRLSTLQGEALTLTAQAHGTEGVKLAGLVRGDLDWIVMKCLEKDRGRRYDTANGLAADLARHLANEPVLARPPSAGYRFQKAFRRHRLAFGAGGAVLVALTVGIAFSTWQAVRANREARRARQAEGLAEQRLTESEAISKFLIEVFQSPDPARDGRTITVAETLGAAARKLETDLASQPARRAQLQATLGKTYHALGLFREAIPLQEKVRDYHRAASGPEHTNTLEALGSLANSYLAAGRWDEALKLREEVLPLSRKVNGPEHIDAISAMNSLAVSYYYADRRDEAIKLQEQVVALRRQVNGPEHPGTLAAMNNLAISYDATGRQAEALKLREEVLALGRKVNGPEHPETLAAMGNLAISYADAGRRAEAVKLQELALVLHRRVLGPEHPDTLGAMNNLMESYAAAGHADASVKLGEEALQLSRKVLGPEHSTTLVVMGNVAAAYREAGRTDEAIRLGQTILEIANRVLGPVDPETLYTMTELAISYRVAGRTAEAITLEEESLRLKRRHLPAGDPRTIESLENLATCYEQADRKPEADHLRQELAELKAKAAKPIPGHALPPAKP